MQTIKIIWSINALNSLNHSIAQYKNNAGITIANDFAQHIRECVNLIQKNPLIAKSCNANKDFR